jgi:cyclophilin family peptidyl-prolyl cis-trans isomerase
LCGNSAAGFRAARGIDCTMAVRLLRLCTNPLAGRSTSASASHLGRRGTKNLDWYINAVAKREELKDVVDPPVFPIETLHGRKRARAFIDFQTGREESAVEANVSRVVVELADDLVPLAVENFLRLCDRPVGQGYKGSDVFHVKKGVGISLGDWVRNDGRGGHSAFEKRHFVDENYIGRHSAPGVLSYANSGVHSNNSVFMMSLAKLPHLGECCRCSAGLRVV